MLTGLLAKVWRGGSCHLEVLPTSACKAGLDLWQCFSSSLQDKGGFPLCFTAILSAGQTLLCPAQQHLEGNRVQGEAAHALLFIPKSLYWPSFCSPHVHLVQSPCRGRLWTQSFFPVKCRACAVGFQNILWSPLQVNWKCSFLPLSLFFYFFLFFYFLCAVRMPVLQVFPTHFFPAFFLSAVLTLLYLHSPAWAPNRASSLRKKPLSGCCRLWKMLRNNTSVYSEISRGRLSGFCSTQLKLSCITQLCRFGLTLVSVVNEKPDWHSCFPDHMPTLFFLDIYRSLTCWAEQNDFVQLMWHA